MITEATLTDLRALIEASASPERRVDLEAAFDDLQRTIAAQSLAIRNLTSELRNRRIGQEAMDAILPAGTLDAMLSRLGQARTTSFSFDDARRACADLADQAARAGDIAAIGAAVVKVVRAFV